MLGEHNIQSVPVKKNRKYTKFLDVLDIVHYIDTQLKEKKISEDEASKLQLDALLKHAGLDQSTVEHVAAKNERANYYPFEGIAPARAVLGKSLFSYLFLRLFWS